MLNINLAQIVREYTVPDIWSHRHKYKRKYTVYEWPTVVKEKNLIWKNTKKKKIVMNDKRVTKRAWKWYK